VRISFYAPLKAPTHPVPSGDRRMARLLMSALEEAGHQTVLASDFRSYEGTGSAFLQKALEATGRVEAEHIIDTCLSQPDHNRPNVWFTYHLYYKAPDYLGPVVCEALDIPYIVAEPSHAPKRTNGPWNIGHQSVIRSLEKVDGAFCLTKHDMACVEPMLTSPERLFYLPPFLEALPFQNGRSEKSAGRKQLANKHGLTADVLLIAVGMMRSGDKFESYRLLAESLGKIDTTVRWQLVIIGDGEEGPKTRNLFLSRNELASKTVFLGEQPGTEIAGILAACDISVWPASGEAYGMALLEAQAAGLPVVAGKLRGVPDVVRDGETAKLVPFGDTSAFAAATKSLIEDQQLRASMGEKAARFVDEERSLQQAADILNRGLNQAVSSHNNKSNGNAL
jgi:glycosyltransferase involved in cell wall biosynthesis